MPFWTRVLARHGAHALELGCGTGRLLAPIARSGVTMTGIDLSERMLARARARARRLPRSARPGLVRGDIRALPFRRRTFGAVLAPYGMLQSLVRDRDLDAALGEAARVLRKGGLLGVDLVPDLPRWEEYGPEVRMRGRTRQGARVELIETVRQDRASGITIFDEEFVETRGRAIRRHRFTLTFRTLSMAATLGRVSHAGFRIDACLGDYQGRPWDPLADTWVVLASRR